MQAAMSLTTTTRRVFSDYAPVNTSHTEDSFDYSDWTGVAETLGNPIDVYGKWTFTLTYTDFAGTIWLQKSSDNETWTNVIL